MFDDRPLRSTGVIGAALYCRWAGEKVNWPTKEKVRGGLPALSWLLSGLSLLQRRYVSGLQPLRALLYGELHLLAFFQ